MEDLIILDYSTNKVHTYFLSRSEPITETYIADLGFDPNNCHWMAGDIEFINHAIVLT